MIWENVLDTRTVNDVEVVLAKGVIPVLHHRAEVFLSAHEREWFVIGVQSETITIKEMIESLESKDHCQELSLNSRVVRSHHMIYFFTYLNSFRNIYLPGGCCSLFIPAARDQGTADGTRIYSYYQSCFRILYFGLFKKSHTNQV